MWSLIGLITIPPLLEGTTVFLLLPVWLGETEHKVTYSQEVTDGQLPVNGSTQSKGGHHSLRSNRLLARISEDLTLPFTYTSTKDIN